MLQEGVYMELAAEDGEHRPRLGKNWLRCCFLLPGQKMLEGTARLADGGEEGLVCTCRQFPGEAGCVSAALRLSSHLTQLRAPSRFMAPCPGGKRLLVLGS